MKQKQFDDIIQNTIETCLTTLTDKNASYNPNEDKLAGFKTAARLRGVTPLQALSGMKVKHTSFVQDVLEGRIELPSEEVIQEKFGDEINYLLLALCLIEEARNDAAKADIAALREQLSRDASEPQPSPPISHGGARIHPTPTDPS